MEGLERVDQALALVFVHCPIEINALYGISIQADLLTDFAVDEATIVDESISNTVFSCTENMNLNIGHLSRVSKSTTTPILILIQHTMTVCRRLRHANIDSILWSAMLHIQLLRYPSMPPSEELDEEMGHADLFCGV